MHVPRNKGELVDHLGWMILGAPEFESLAVRDCDIDVAFGTLARGIETISSQVGEKGRTELDRMSSEARAFYEEGRVLEGNSRLHEMQVYIRKKGH